MSVTNPAKPPRPCTEYNLFFQLERCYILQEILHSDPSLSCAEESFHPSQPSYANHPPLPARYASLVLPYDWHLPGKEKRRKRKHRKSHGVIGFQELSNRISDAWKGVDADIKRFCGHVSSLGLKKYKTDMKAWKKSQSGKSQGACQILSAMAVLEKSKKNESSEDTPKLQGRQDLTLDLLLSPKDTVSDEDAPLPTTWEGLNQIELVSPISDTMALDFQDNDLLGLWAQDELSPPEGTFISGQVTSSDTKSIQNKISLEKVASQGNVFSRNSSTVSDVDIEDEEILKMWHNCKADESTVDDTIADSTSANTFNNSKAQSYDSMFGTKGYTQMLEEIQLMKSKLERQAKEMERVRSMQRRSVAAFAA